MFSLNILFANDDVLTQWIMTEVLTDGGFHVTSACRAQQVIELLDDEPEFDVLLADLTLSDEAAPFDIGHHWNRVLPGRPVIYTVPDMSALRRPLMAGESVLVTPFSAASLLQTIDRAVEYARYRPVADTLTHDHYQFN